EPERHDGLGRADRPGFRGSLPLGTEMTDWMKEEDLHVLPTYEKFPFGLVRGEGVHVWDEAGNKYLDLYGGHAVAPIGHSPATVVDAVTRQAKELLFYSNLVY